MNSPPGAAHLNYTVGALVAVGGAIGYMQRKSVPSLVAGVGIGSLYAYSAYLISNGQSENGHLLATVTSTALTLVMGNRWRRTGNAMPAALLTGVGVGAGVYNGIKWNEWRR